MDHHKITCLQVVHSANHWPFTSNTDYSDIRAYRHEETFERNGVHLAVTYRRCCSYEPYVIADGGPLPVTPGPWNSGNPDPRYAKAFVSYLRECGEGCQAVSWVHASRCYPAVAQHLKEMFRLAILEFGDDCPGSSEFKTFPVARYFDAIAHQMNVFDYASGARVADIYAGLGLPYARLTPTGPSAGLDGYLRSVAFTIECKAQRIRQGGLPIGLFFVGGNGYPNPHRRAFLDALNERASEIEAMEISARLHGARMRDGVLGEYYVPAGPIVGPGYVDALFTVNFPVSSLLNSRLLDAWSCGTIQLIPDRNGELAEFGFVEDEHFIGFDGTFDDFLRKLAEWKDRRDDLAKIALAAYAKRDFQRKLTPWHDIYFDHIDQLLHGRPA